MENSQIVKGDLEYDGRVIFYIIKADPTSYINYIKPLILAQELRVPHVICVIDTKSEWYYSIHPERYVPALRDKDPETEKDVVVFESTACIQYLAERFDTDGTWSGRNAWEKAAVLSWTAYQTAGLGPTSKYWLYFAKGYPSREKPEILPKTLAKLRENVLKQWDIMEKRLSEPDQSWIAVPDRATIADLSYFPFTIPWMFMALGVNIKDWPKVEDWNTRMLLRPVIREVMAKGPTYGRGL